MKKTIYIGNSLETFNAVKEALDRRSIPYKFKTKGDDQGYGSGTMTIWERFAVSERTRYEIIVAETDYDETERYLHDEGIL